MPTLSAFMKTKLDNLARFLPELVRADFQLGEHVIKASGQATILATETDVEVPLADWKGRIPGAIVFQDPADGTLTEVVRVHWNGDNLVSTGNAAATADTIVAYWVL